MADVGPRGRWWDGGDAMARLGPLFSGLLLALGLGTPGLVAAQPGQSVDVGQRAPAFTLLGPSLEPFG
jgi:hypothetical protein